MASYYPHKQTVIIAIVCIVVVGGVFIYAKQGSDAQKMPATPTLSSVEVAPSNTSASSSDWRLSFVDRQSVPARETTKNPAAQQDLTLTDQFGRDFFARYIQLKQSNLIENQSFVTDTLNQSIYSAAQAAEQPRKYADTDILVISLATAANIRSYGNSIGSIFSSYGIDADPAIIANEAFDKGDMNLLSKIDPVISSYENIIRALKALPTPKPLAAYHLDLLNSVSGMSKIVRDIRAVESDPMQTMVSISEYADVQQSLVSSLRSMKSYFSLVGVVFASTEPGSLFSQII